MIRVHTRPDRAARSPSQPDHFGLRLRAPAQRAHARLVPCEATVARKRVSTAGTVAAVTVTSARTLGRDPANEAFVGDTSGPQRERGHTNRRSLRRGLRRRPASRPDSGERRGMCAQRAGCAGTGQNAGHPRPSGAPWGSGSSSAETMARNAVIPSAPASARNAAARTAGSGWDTCLGKRPKYAKRQRAGRDARASSKGTKSTAAGAGASSKRQRSKSFIVRPRVWRG